MTASPAAPFHSGVIPDPLAGLSVADRSRYSITRAIRAGLGMREDGKAPDGVEGAVHRALQPLAKRGGIMVPLDLRTPAERTLTTSQITKGAEAVTTRPGALIDLLGARSVLLQSGALFATFTGGPVEFCKVTGGNSVTWMAENPASDVSDSDIQFGLANLVPRVAASSTAFTRQLLAQSSLGVDAIVTKQLADASARGLDRAAFHGLGAANEPTGIYKSAGVGAAVDFSSTVPTFAKCIDVIGKAMDSNGDPATLGVVTTPLMSSVLQKTTREAAGGLCIWHQGAIGDAPARYSGSVSKTMSGAEATGGTQHGFVAGCWGELLIAAFAFEVVMDPYAKKRRGLIECATFLHCDVLLMHPEAFCTGINGTLS